MPTAADVLSWLGDNSGSSEVAATVQTCLDAVTASIESRCSLPSTYPPDVSQAITMAAARLYRRKASGDGIVQLDGMGVIRVGSFDADVENLLQPYLNFAFA